MKGIGNDDFYESRSSFGVQVVQVFLLSWVLPQILWCNHRLSVLDSALSHLVIFIPTKLCSRTKLSYSAVF